ncbi:hypothetical protein CDS [Bradyrhizobium sp.]|nr:hypothetical protein CDS [Bradyrhizobium sp.]
MDGGPAGEMEVSHRSFALSGLSWGALLGRRRGGRAVSEKPGLHDTFRPVGAMLAYQRNSCHPLGV